MERQSASPVSLRPVEAPTRGAETRRVPVLLIDPRPLTQELLARWLEAGALGFRIDAVTGPGELDGDRTSLGGVELVVFNIGAAGFTDAEVRDTVGELGRRYPGVPIVLFAEREEVAQIAAAVRHGVRGYITPSLSPDVAAEALRLVRAGGTFIPATAVLAAVQQERQTPQPAPRAIDGDFEEFTPRELEVLDRLGRGLSNKIIAYELDICGDTVKVHVKHIMRKLRVTNRTQAALLARRLFDGQG